MILLIDLWHGSKHILELPRQLEPGVHWPNVSFKEVLDKLIARCLDAVLERCFPPPDNTVNMLCMVIMCCASCVVQWVEVSMKNMLLPGARENKAAIQDAKQSSS